MNPFIQILLAHASFFHYNASGLSGNHLFKIQLGLKAYSFFSIHLPGSLWCMSILIVSRKWSRIFSGVPDITVYLRRCTSTVSFKVHETRPFFLKVRHRERCTLMYTGLYARLLKRTWCFPGWRREDSFLTPARLVRALSNALCWLPRPKNTQTKIKMQKCGKCV